MTNSSNIKNKTSDTPVAPESPRVFSPSKDEDRSTAGDTYTSKSTLSIASQASRRTSEDFLITGGKGSSVVDSSETFSLTYAKTTNVTTNGTLFSPSKNPTTKDVASEMTPQQRIAASIPKKAPTKCMPSDASTKGFQSNKSTVNQMAENKLKAAPYSEFIQRQEGTKTDTTIDTTCTQEVLIKNEDNPTNNNEKNKKQKVHHTIVDRVPPVKTNPRYSDDAGFVHKPYITNNGRFPFDCTRCQFCGYAEETCRNTIQGEYALNASAAYIIDIIRKQDRIPSPEVLESHFKDKFAEILKVETKMVTGKYDNSSFVAYFPTCVKEGTYANIMGIHASLTELFTIRAKKVRKGATELRLENVMKMYGKKGSKY